MNLREQMKQMRQREQMKLSINKILSFNLVSRQLINQEHTSMKLNPYHQTNHLLIETKYQSSSKLINKNKNNTSKSISEREGHKHKQKKKQHSSKVSTHSKSSIMKDIDKQHIKDSSSKKRTQSSQRNTSIKHHTYQKNPKTNPLNKQVINALAQTTIQQLYINELQEKNYQYLLKIHLLQSQIKQKDLLLDQCQQQISVLKHNFNQLFCISSHHKSINIEKQTKQLYPNQINRQSINPKMPKMQDEQHNQHEYHKQHQQDEIMRRIQYSQDTLKLSQTSFSITTYEQPHNYFMQDSSFQVSNSQNNQENQKYYNSQKLHNQLLTRKPLQNIQNQNAFIKNKLSQKPIAGQKITDQQHRNNIQNYPKSHIHCQGNDGLSQRKSSVSAITATHRLAAFYHKKNS